MTPEEDLKERRRAACRRYRKNHRDKLIRLQREAYKANAEKNRQYARDRRAALGEAFNEHERKRYAANAVTLNQNKRARRAAKKQRGAELLELRRIEIEAQRPPQVPGWMKQGVF